MITNTSTFWVHHTKRFLYQLHCFGTASIKQWRRFCKQVFPIDWTILTTRMTEQYFYEAICSTFDVWWDGLDRFAVVQDNNFLFHMTDSASNQIPTYCTCIKKFQFNTDKIFLCFLEHLPKILTTAPMLEQIRRVRQIETSNKFWRHKLHLKKRKS